MKILASSDIHHLEALLLERMLERACREAVVRKDMDPKRRVAVLEDATLEMQREARRRHQDEQRCESVPR